MKYALGNMLNGAGGMNPDGLALDLQFATDKTLTARRGPSPILTRTNNIASFVGNNGLIQYAGTNVARFDHDPTSPFACRGLLIEDQRENLLLRSEEFDSSAVWSTSGGITVNPNQTASPDGLVTADQLTSSVSNGAIFQAFNAVAGTRYTFSVWVKSVSSAVTSVLRFNNSGGNLASVTFTTSTSWQRVTVPYTSANTEQLRAVIGGGSTLGVGTTLYVWGAQVEVGSFATSYIPTTTASVVRSADVCTITGGAFNSFYNQSEGTFLSSTQLFSIGNDYDASYWNVFEASTANYMRVSVYDQTSTQEKSFLQSNDSALNSTVASVTSRTSRVAGAYQTNNARIAKNGTLGILDTEVTPYASYNSLTIMSQASGTIASLRYYRKRLPDAKLQALTA